MANRVNELMKNVAGRDSFDEESADMIGEIAELVSDDSEEAKCARAELKCHFESNHAEEVMCVPLTAVSVTHTSPTDFSATYDSIRTYHMSKITRPMGGPAPRKRQKTVW
eukprot:SAG11_NODE_12293_length_710_cov_1.522095_1_plen_110_part_00